MASSPIAPFRRNDGYAQNNHNQKNLITPSQQRAAQTMPAHLHLCGANLPGTWPLRPQAKETMLRNRIHTIHISSRDKDSYVEMHITINGENFFLSRMSSAAKRECKVLIRWMRSTTKWMNDACATTQPRLRHNLARIWIVFFSEQSLCRVRQG